MDAERWRLISQLYRSALARAASERHIFLESACGSDKRLKQEVESLLLDGASVESIQLMAAADALGGSTARADRLDSVSIPPGAMLGSYRVERLLGRGGMGAVFLAYDTTLYRSAAVKVLNVDLSRDQLLREARNAAALSHPNICTIYEVGAADGTPFIAMEYVNGQSVRDRLSEGTLSIDEALRYGIQAADALAYAHEHGVVHRDFKAANIIVDAEGRLRVVDFGLARRGDAVMAGVTTMSSLLPRGTAAGTPYAMAPEQVRGGMADARTDVWALGVLLYEMAAGAEPFTAASVHELFSSILRDAPKTLPDAVPISLRGVIERCLEKDPLLRYQHAREVRDSLEAIRGDAAPAWSAWRYYLRHRRGVVAAAALLGLSTVAVGLNLAGVRDRLTGGDDRPIKLAVLPFQNLTGDPDQEFFSDGLTDEMITQLGRLHPQRLSVIARTSSMLYKGRDVPVDQIGRDLGVDYVMEGSARREGSRVRVLATLVQVGDQTQLWSESFERDLASILVLQSDVASGVARALALTLLPEEQSRLATARPVNPEAYEAYLRGRFHWQALGPKSLDTAMSYFELAVQKDPNYALAYTGIGTVWGLRCNSGAVPCPVALPKWKEAALKARALDPNLPETQAQTAAVAFYIDWDWLGAEREFRRALELDSSYPDTHMWYADFLQAVGRFDEAIAEGRRAIELDPQNSLYQGLMGRTLLLARRDDEAIRFLRDVVKGDPARRNAQVQLGNALARAGKYDEAFAIMHQMAPNPGLADRLRRAYAEGGFPSAARVRADNVAQQSQDAFGVAGFYARAGEKALALDWLEKGFEQRGPGLLHLRVAPDWDFVRSEPRFQAVLSRMKFPN